MMLCDKDEAVMLLGAAIALIQQNKMAKIAAVRHTDQPAGVIC
jgi:hypothetical protein